ncbi:hypothetical protein YZ82_02900 [Campylobacter hyointestinalis]|uniref:TonB-dependent receptor plug domain-containing protein n=1 Tax=Campylobacter hyointestinalis TaxID=198 RepID=A0A562XII3_CAMHY|nr:TonB-dependent receptor plug domain-containing protein [Campylobacter hyointestinalis]TWO21949.1 hypothetical protein YZ82_02900 [Campylobacter hyointestinalis]
MNKATLAFVFASSCAFCDSAQLEAVNIIGSSEQSIASNGEFLGSTRYDKDAIDASLSKDGTISDIIKKNPNARVSRGERTSKNGGEIAPKNISINGAEVYQNNFTLDGININNDINPLGGILSTGSAANITPFLSNPSLGLSVNTDLLENIEVIDSFVSAKYGGFQGGVINAKTRDPKREFGGKIYFGYTSDNLTKVHIDDIEQESYDYATSSSYQPEFKKYKSGVTLEGYVSENFGLMFDYNRLYSTILQRKYSADYDIDVSKKDEKRNMHRMNENYFLKGVYTNDRLKLTPSILYAPYSATYYSIGGENAKAEVKGGGVNLNLGVDYEFNSALFKQNFGLNTTSMDRQTDSDKMLVWWKSKTMQGYTPSKTTTVIDGLGGDIEQNQKNLLYNSSIDFEDVDIFGISNRFSLGAQLEKINAKYDITKPYVSANSAIRLGDGKTCAAGDIFCLEGDVVAKGKEAWKAQYFNKHYKYNGKIEFDYNQASFWLEDRIKISNLTLKPGVRLDKNDYMGGLNIAPRFVANLDVFDDNNTNIFGGFNRYYGRNILAYKLREGMASLMKTYTRADENSPWIQTKTEPSAFKFSSLNVPYDDEIGIGATQKIGNLELGVKYLRREGKDLIRRSSAKKMSYNLGDNTTLKEDYSVYTNEGKSLSHIYTLSLNTISDIFVAGVSNAFGLSFNYIDSKRNFNTYEDVFDEYQTTATKVIFNGNLINQSELPNNTNKTPWNINANLVTKLPYKLSLGNFLNIQGGFDGIISDASQTIGGKTYRAYKSKKIGPAFSLDMRLSYEKNLVKNSAFFANLDISNLLNRKNIETIDSAGVMSYDTGRQIWLEVGYKW